MAPVVGFAEQLPWVGSAGRRVGAYAGAVQVVGVSPHDDVRLTVEAAVDIANAINGGADAAEVRDLLVAHEFHSAVDADEVETQEAFRALTWLSGLIDGLPETSLPDAVAAINRALASRAISPSIVSHDGAPLHIHWTNPQVPLGARVVVDSLMAVAQSLCEHGVERFGRCQADGCSDVYYDATKNRSRRFCNDPRCASRTHTANHRARSRS